MIEHFANCLYWDDSSQCDGVVAKVCMVMCFFCLERNVSNEEYLDSAQGILYLTMIV